MACKSVEITKISYRYLYRKTSFRIIKRHLLFTKASTSTQNPCVKIVKTVQYYKSQRPANSILKVLHKRIKSINYIKCGENKF